MTQSNLMAYSDKELLSMRVKDLPLDKRGLPRPEVVERLFGKLTKRGFCWRPEIWASDEWFSPDGRAGFAFPFTLLDERLIALEKKLIGFCEGSTEGEFEKLINHECAHALDNAFGLRDHPKRIEIFGDPETPYPRTYLPLPHSKRYVRHLPGNYAQAHPEEDWAETFAVWLGTKSRWKKRYENWPAMNKLNACDEIMREIRNTLPRHKGRGRPLHFTTDERTLAQYFAWKKKEFGLRRRNFFSRSAKIVFATKGKRRAIEVIQKNEKSLAQSLVCVTGIKAYEAKHMIRELKHECKKRDYSLLFKERESIRKIEKILLASAPQYIEGQKRRIFM